MDREHVEFEWTTGPDVTEEQLVACAALYSDHYGVWGPQSNSPGRRIRLPVDRLRDLIRAWAAFAKLDGRLIGYAFIIRDRLTGKGVVSWVTQLVVHHDYRNEKVATNLLRSVWGFSDHFAWGLVTANPYAVRALEAATRRRCKPAAILDVSHELYSMGRRLIPYINKPPRVTQRTSKIDTEFYVDHGAVPEMLRRASEKVPWRMGLIGDGEEWFAFTLRSQEEFRLAPEELHSILADADRTLKRAYESMALDAGHRWARHWRREVDYIVAFLDLRPGARILDFGCGKGRHALELARRGYGVVGVDFIDSFIRQARDVAKSQGLAKASFVTDDCRTFWTGEEFDAVICLYDVVGSHPNDADNQAILNNIERNLRRDGRTLVSVMNMDLAWRLAKFKADVERNPDALLQLKPSRTMQDTGHIWNPDYYLIDRRTRIVYRKEQFEAPGFRLPCELIVRDRRYDLQRFVDMCSAAGLEEIWCRRVRAGSWDANLAATDERAKEILYLGVRP